MTYAGGKVINANIEEPTKPETPKEPDNTSRPDVAKVSTSKNVPKTGDTSNMTKYCGITLLSGSVLIFIGILSKKKHS